MSEQKLFDAYSEVGRLLQGDMYEMWKEYVFQV